MIRSLRLYLYALFLALAVHHVSSQSACEEFVNENEALVNTRTVERLSSNDITLQDVVECLEEDGSLVLALQRLELTQPIILNKRLLISGNFSEPTSIDCNGLPLFTINAMGVQFSNLQLADCALSNVGSLIHMQSGSTVRLSSVHFRRNVHENGSAVINMDSGSTLTIESSSFVKNTGTTADAIAADADCNIVIKDSIFRENVGRGSVIALSSGSRIIISNSQFAGNRANSSGAVLSVQTGANATVVDINDGSYFHNNMARNHPGGALFLDGNVLLRVKEDVIFSKNQADYQGGAIYYRGFSLLAISNAFFVENKASFLAGGAIYVENSSGKSVNITLSETTFSKNSIHNKLGSGGAIALVGDGVHCVMDQGMSFISNTALFDGGAIYISGGRSFRIIDASFLGNEAREGGAGAIFVLSASKPESVFRMTDVVIESSTFFSNVALSSHRGGGCIGLTGKRTQATVKNSQFEENESRVGSGGAIYIYDEAIVDVSHSHFVGNRALWGGAIYAQRNVRCDVMASVFLQNKAEEGGAFHTRGAVLSQITDSVFESNSAIEEGGAIKSLNTEMSGDNQARVTLNHSRFLNNHAGFDIAKDYATSTLTRGGALFAGGAGNHINVVQSTFANNSASAGGGIAATGVSHFSIRDHTSFERNEANVGAGIFLLVDPAVVIAKEFYRVHGVDFRNNTAYFCGAGMRIISINSNNWLSSYNARKNTVLLEEALNFGGAIAIDAVGLVSKKSTFIRNSATPLRGFESRSGGGAIAVDYGASAQIEHCSFEDNKADLNGGAIHVLDASATVRFSNFTGNSVQSYLGNGGAVSISIDAARLIPLIEGGPRSRSILLACRQCRFVRNSAGYLGGAIYHMHSDPFADDTSAENCSRSIPRTNFVQSAPLITNENANNFTCLWKQNLHTRLKFRGLRLSDVIFEGNEAENGAAIFTNQPSHVNLTTDHQEPSNEYPSDGYPLTTAYNNDSAQMEALVIFKDNRIVSGGYGCKFASTPVRTILCKDHDDGNGGEETEKKECSLNSVTFGKFRSGSRLNFTIQFEDAFGQIVKNLEGLSGELRYSENLEEANIGGVDQQGPEISGQIISRFEKDGNMHFSGTRIRGKANRSYNLNLRFFFSDHDLRMENLSFIKVKIRKCRIGEETREENGLIECVGCRAGQFNAQPLTGYCLACENVTNGRCFGATVIPHNEYWHASSFSTRMIRCIGQDSCSERGRMTKINRTEIMDHMKGQRIDYTNTSNEFASLQCSSGYEGILCGTCETGYGREGDQCRKCATRGIRYFLLFLLIFWSFGFLAYFIRSVLQLFNRIEFNKRFGALANSQSRPPAEVLPESAVSNEHIPREEIQPEMHRSMVMEIHSQDDEADQTSILAQNPNIPSRAVTRKDLALVLANKINVERCQSRKQINESNLTNSLTLNKRKTRLVSRLQQIQNNPSARSIEPLTLANPVSEVLKILINFLQVTAMAVNINVEWTDVMIKTLYGFASVGNLATGTGYTSLDCFFKTRSTSKALRRMTISILYPLLVLVAFISFFFIKAKVTRAPKKYLVQRIWLTFLSINYFFYIGLTKNLLRFFACVELGEDGEDEGLALPHQNSYWEEDTTVQCYTGPHGALLGVLVAPLLCAVSIGFPLGTFFSLQANAKDLDNEDFIGTYGFLYRAYDRHYWEIVIMLRKGLIAAVAVFGYTLGANIQGLLCVVILGASLALHLTFVPFTKDMPKLNYLETCSLSATIVVYVSGLMFNDPKTTNGSEVFITVMTIFFVAATLLLIFLEFISSSEEFIDMTLLENGVMNCEELCEAGLSKKLEQFFLHYVNKVWTMATHINNIMPKKRRQHVPAESPPSVQMSSPLSTAP